MSVILSKKCPDASAKCDEEPAQRLIEEVNIHEDKFTVAFKSGATMDVVE